VGILTSSSVLLRIVENREDVEISFHFMAQQNTITGIYYIYPLTNWQTFVTSQSPHFKSRTVLQKDETIDWLFGY